MLSKLHLPKDLKTLNTNECELLAEEIRERLIHLLSTNPCGGHLSSNLGIVEITLAMHKVFNAPEDKFIFDTSHQTYVHKILTGRNDKLRTLRQLNGVCGFSSPQESPYDHFYAGHAGTALSLALGMAKSRDLQGGSEYIVPVLGDAAFSCGLTLEALNNIPSDLKNFLCIVNDNSMFISQSVGSITDVLKSSHLSADFFKPFGFDYLGPFDGHNFEETERIISGLKNLTRPTLLHLKTIKGKGMPLAEEAPTTYHGVKPFNQETGQFIKANPSPTFPKIFGKHLLNMADKNPDILAITPAMPTGSCLTQFMEKHPERCLDVGIAEGHSITYAGGIAYSKKQTVFACIYATFLQRAFDNLFQDVCLQELPVIFALDRGGIAGPDGATHNGIYDIGFLNSMPNMVIAQPRNGDLLKELMESAPSYNKPTAIRYPNLPTEVSETQVNYRELGIGEVIAKGEDVAIIALGHKVYDALDARDLLKQHDIHATVVDPVFIKPLDRELFYQLFMTHKHIFTIEEHSVTSGLGSILNSFIVKEGFLNLHVQNIGIPEEFVHHGSHKQVSQQYGLDSASIANQILRSLSLQPTAEQKVKV